MNSPPPLISPFDSGGVRPAGAWVAWFSQLFTFISGLADFTQANIQAPLTGFAITLGDRDTALMLTPAGVLATGTVTMPVNPYDGQPIQVSSTQTVTALTVAANAGQTIKNAPTALTAGLGFSYFYNKTAATWYRLH